jgi:hypothetical protein
VTAGPTSAKRASLTVGRGYWTKERVFAEGKKHKNRRAWQLAQSRSYAIAWRNGWLDEIIGREITHGKWTKKAVVESGGRYPTKSAWRNSADGSAYVIAKRNGWLVELTHFESELSFGERTIYKWLLEHDVVFEKEKTFPGLRARYPLRYDFWVPSKRLLIEYQGRQHEVGWSGDAKDAKEIQKRDAEKFDFAKRNDLILIYIDSVNAADIEAILQREIGPLPSRALTKGETGRLKNLGGWSKERALADARRYSSRKAWNKASHGYAYARLNGFLNEACAHMVRENAWTRSRKLIWTKDAILVDAKKYKRKIEWRKKSPSAYVIAKRNGWLKEASVHMMPSPKGQPPSKWTKSAVLREAAKYQSKSEWDMGSPSSYRTSLSKGWHEEATAHMARNSRAPSSRRRVMKSAC